MRCSVKKILSRSLLTILSFSPLFAQNGDRRHHHTQEDIVPKELIPPAPVLTVDQALKAFTIQDGFVIEPVAAEPLVEKPVALAFDNKGRMWVCEMLGYMAKIDGTGEDKPVGRIAILEDTTGNGVVDKRTTFLENILLPRAIAIVPGGILFADQEALYFVARKGDAPAADPVVVDAKYALGSNVEHKPNGLMPGIDNWLYNAKSNRRYKFIPGENTVIKERTSTRGQWGITRDNFGRLYHNSNSTLLVGDRTLPNLLEGNKAVKLKTSISTLVGSNYVYPGRITPGVNRAYISTLNGYNDNTIDPKTYKLIEATAACGPVIYRGNNYPQNFQNRAFVCESAAQLVKMIQLDHQGSEITGTHPLKNKEFLTSTDERFRPVNLYNAPDGSLYLLDFYHGIIQHHTYMTSYLRKQVLSRKLDGPSFGHGRIYRIRSTAQPLTKAPDFSTADTATVSAALGSPIGAIRDLAQLELIARKASAAEINPPLNGRRSHLHQTHIIWTLEALGHLTTDHLTSALTSGHEELIASALYAALSLPDQERTKLTSTLISLKSSTLTLPYQARLLASISTKEAQEALVTFLKKYGDEDFVKQAAIAGLAKNAQLFDSVNQGRYSSKRFNTWLKESKKGPQAEIDPKSLIKGEHLASFIRGEKLYMNRAACIGCHGANGAGIDNLGPQLDHSDWVTGPETRLVKVLLHGLTGPIKIHGETFTPQAFMPGLGQNTSISDQDIADISTYLRANWTNRAPQVTTKTVTETRDNTKDRSPGQMYTQKEFN